MIHSWHRICMLLNAHVEDVLHLKMIITKLMKRTSFCHIGYIKGAVNDMTIG